MVKFRHNPVTFFQVLSAVRTFLSLLMGAVETDLETDACRRQEFQVKDSLA